MNADAFPCIISITDAIRVIDEWLIKGYPYVWKKPPEWIKEQLRQQAGLEESIPCIQAINILRQARALNTLPNANRGMACIEERWKYHCRS